MDFHFLRCFYNVNVMPESTRSRLYVEHANIKGSHRVFTTYAIAKYLDIKKELNDRFDLKLDKSWHWHHVVEKTHLKPLYTKRVYERMYDFDIPCVLIDYKTEHYDYNSLLHTAGAKAVFDLAEKSRKILKGAEREDYLNKLNNLYTNAYSHDHVLKNVAHYTLAQF